jgi:hypothetical protein
MATKGGQHLLLNDTFPRQSARHLRWKEQTVHIQIAKATVHNIQRIPKSGHRQEQHLRFFVPAAAAPAAAAAAAAAHLVVVYPHHEEE